MIKLSDPNHLHASKDQLFFNAETNLDDSTDAAPQTHPLADQLHPIQAAS